MKIYARKRVVEIYTSLEMCLEDQDSYYGPGIINKSIGDISRGRHAGFPLQSVDEDAFEYGPLNVYTFRGLNDHDKNTLLRDYVNRETEDKCVEFHVEFTRK